MHLLLPPSETKRSGGGSVFVPEALAHHELLAETREAVRSALVSLSQDTEAAAQALKLGVKNRGEVQHNLELARSGGMAAIDRYTGVLYDALDTASLDDEARAWLSEHVSVQSALFGLLRSDDVIPAYRLSGSSRLPGLGGTLKRTWAAAHESLAWADFAWVLDLRSKDYVALAPLPAEHGSWLHVVQRGPGGEVRALNHFNKAAKGDLVRRLAQDHATIDGPAEFVEWASTQGLEASFDVSEATVTLVTELGAPARNADEVAS